MSAFGQSQSDEYLKIKLQRRENMVVKEWNTDQKSKAKWLDRITTYNDKGEKTEEIEYSRYGQNWRKTYVYDDAGHIIKETEYDERDKVAVVRKYEYNDDDTKKKQYNYAPNGRLLTVKIFEYERTGK